MKIVRLILIFIAVPLLAQAQSSFCSKDSIPDVIHVTLVNCGEQKELFLRHDGDDRDLRPLTPTATPGVWQLNPLGGSVESNVLCTTFCGYASTCLSGSPHPDKENGKKICVAQYEFRCNEEAWTLAVQSSPSVTIDWTRKRSGVEQRGELKTTPGKLCDLASDEEINLKPQIAVTTFTFRDIPVKQKDLQQQRSKTWTLGPNDLVKYVVRPEGKRTEPPSDVEKAFLSSLLSELTLKIDSKSKSGGK